MKGRLREQALFFQIQYTLINFILQVIFLAIYYQNLFDVKYKINF